MVQRTNATVSLIPCRLAITFEMEGDRTTFPLDEVSDRIDDEINVGNSTSIAGPSIEGDFEVVVKTRTNIIIGEWVQDAQRAINLEASTDHTVIGWRVESI